MQNNLRHFEELQQNASKPAAYAYCPPNCPPTFIAATCPAILGVPPRVYTRLLEPSGSIGKIARKQKGCWHSDKHIRRSGFNETRLRQFEEIIAFCEKRMSEGIRYPRRRQELKVVYNKEVWETLDVSEELKEKYPDIPRQEKDCSCPMDAAVSAYLSAARTPPSQQHVDMPPELSSSAALQGSDGLKELENLRDWCPPCTISHAWSAYTHIFNITFATPPLYRLLPLSLRGPPPPTQHSIALGWLALKRGILVNHSPKTSTSKQTRLDRVIIKVINIFLDPSTLIPRTTPSAIVQSIYYRHMLPTPHLHTPIQKNLPPIAVHSFWSDISDYGLPYNSEAKIGVPDVLTEALRRWGDGGDPFLSWEKQLWKLSNDSKEACLNRGWCFPEEFKRGDPIVLEWAETKGWDVERIWIGHA